MEELACEQGLTMLDWQGFLEAYLKAEHESDEFLLITGSYFLAQVRKSILENRKLTLSRASSVKSIIKNKNEHRSIYGH